MNVPLHLIEIYQEFFMTLHYSILLLGPKTIFFMR